MRRTHSMQVGKVSLVLLLAVGAAVAGAQVRATSTSLELSTDGSKVTANVHVAGTGSPTGVVTLLATEHAVSHELGSVALDATGNAKVELDGNSAVGALKAVYRGDGANGGSVSGEGVIHPLYPANPDYTFTIVASTFTLKAGTYGTTVATITPTGGFNGNVSFFCTGLPLNTECVFTPTTVQTSAGAATTSLQILTSAAGGIYAQQKTGRMPWVMAGSFVLAIGFFVLAGRKKAYSGWLRAGSLMAMGAFMLLALSGCNARYDYLNHHPNPIGGGTPTGTYSMSITANSDNGVTTTTHTLPFVLTVD